jgi:hypothetical protein
MRRTNTNQPERGDERASKPMSATIALAILAATTILGSVNKSAYADRTYKLYRSTPFGTIEDPLRPSAVIEIDNVTGRGTVYDTDKFGGADILKGPSTSSNLIHRYFLIQTLPRIRTVIAAPMSLQTGYTRSAEANLPRDH